jgi:hypothetical protein
MSGGIAVVISESTDKTSLLSKAPFIRLFFHVTKKEATGVQIRTIGWMLHPLGP